MGWQPIETVINKKTRQTSTDWKGSEWTDVLSLEELYEHVD